MALSNKNFLNPYNFVSYDNRANNKKKYEDYFSGTLLKGYLNCELITITPLALKEDDDYYIDGNPCIIASSIRGPIRNVFETITNSCFSKFEKDKLKNRIKDYRIIGPCNSIDSICEACALFGALDIEKTDIYNRKNKTSINSRISISDAIYVGDECKFVDNGDYVYIEQLNSPHRDNDRFYADNEYDEKEKARINGRKYYWNYEYKKQTIKDKNRAIKKKLIDCNQSFKFKVYFEGITENQLNKLMWALTMGDNKQPNNTEGDIYCHKIGGGKPYGLGSVKITITKGYKISNKDKTSLEEMDISIKPIDNQITKELKYISKYYGKRIDDIDEKLWFEDDITTNRPEIRYPSLEWFRNHENVVLMTINALLNDKSS